MTFILIVGFAYLAGALDGYTAWSTGYNYYGYYEEISHNIGGYEWLVLYAAYGIRVIIQIASVIYGWMKKDTPEEKIVSEKTEANMSCWLPAIFIWIFLGVATLFFTPVPQGGGYYRDSGDLPSVEEMQTIPVVGGCFEAYKPLHWVMEPQKDQNFGWLNVASIFIGIAVLIGMIMLAGRRKWWSEILGIFTALYLWGYILYYPLLMLCSY